MQPYSKFQIIQKGYVVQCLVSDVEALTPVHLM